MNASVRVLRGIFVLVMVGVGGFFAWWTVVIWDNIGDRSADNRWFTYFVVGLFPALMTGLSVALAVSAIPGEKARFAWLATAALAVLLVAVLSEFFG